jgi:hypothetical protein
MFFRREAASSNNGIEPSLRAVNFVYSSERCSSHAALGIRRNEYDWSNGTVLDRSWINSWRDHRAQGSSPRGTDIMKIETNGKA